MIDLKQITGVVFHFSFRQKTQWEIEYKNLNAKKKRDFHPALNVFTTE